MTKFVAIIVLSLLLNTCTEPPNLLQQVKDLGELRVVTRESSSTYYQGPSGPLGLEYDLAKRFAKYLDVTLVMYAPDDFTTVLPKVVDGEAHLAAAHRLDLGAGEPDPALEGLLEVVVAAGPAVLDRRRGGSGLGLGRHRGP